MRTHEECKAEIFRRSAQRIEDRKKFRTKILLTVLPMILVSVTATAMLFPKPSEGDESYAPQPSVDHQQTAPPHPGISVESSTPILLNTIYDKEQKNSVNEFLQFSLAANRGDANVEDSNFGQSSDGKHTSSEEANGSPTDITVNLKGATEYIIRITDEIGSEQKYLLKGNLLTDIGENRSAILTDTERKTLLDLLGIEE